MDLQYYTRLKNGVPWSYTYHEFGNYIWTTLLLHVIQLKKQKPKDQQCTHSQESKGSTAVRRTVRLPISSLDTDSIGANTHVDQYHHILSSINSPHWDINTLHYILSSDDPFICLFINLGYRLVWLYGVPGESYKQRVAIRTSPLYIGLVPYLICTIYFTFTLLRSRRQAQNHKKFKGLLKRKNSHHSTYVHVLK